jgi:hypothetical protein
MEYSILEWLRCWGHERNLSLGYECADPMITMRVARLDARRNQASTLKIPVAWRGDLQ